MLKKVCFGLLLIFLLGGISVSLVDLEARLRHPARDHPITIEIKPGSSARDIAQLLHEKGVIASPFWFTTFSKLLGLSTQFRAGEYAFRPHEGMIPSLWKLSQGKVSGKQLAFVVPEGYTVGRMAMRLKKIGYTSAGDFYVLAKTGKRRFVTEFPFLAHNPTESLEGYLFPDTYAIAPSAQPEVLLRMMLSRFQEKVVPLWEQHLTERSPSAQKRTSFHDKVVTHSRVTNLHDMLTLASIVEKEASLPKERGLISGVYLRRLGNGMLLRSCPTLKYVLPNPGKNLSFDDLKYASPYNTYLQGGLPPGPICNPGRASFQAALHPTPSEYLYFVSDGKGGNRFSKTYSQHLTLQHLTR